MAKNGTVYDVYRESSVYVSAEIQGYLERKKGVLGVKTKQWCSLQGLTLYLQKKQSDVIETIDLKEAIQVRKVTNENTGTHFEICMKKKNHVFICPSNEDCLAWIQALQYAMARKNASQQSSSFLTGEASFTDDKNVYNEIDEALIRESCVCNMNLSDRQQPVTTAQISDYTEPNDIENGGRKYNSDYCEIVDVKNTLHKSSSASIYDSSALSTTYATIDQDCDDEYSEATENRESTVIYSQVNKNKQATLLPRSSVSENNIAQIGDKLDEHFTSGVTINSVVEKQSTSHEDNNFVKSENLQMNRPQAEEDSKMCQILVDALSDSGCSNNGYIHPLTEEDRKPVKELTEFLSNNREICRASYSCMSTHSDPVSSLKSYLASLDISMRKVENC